MSEPKSLHPSDFGLELAHYCPPWEKLPDDFDFMPRHEREMHLAARERTRALGAIPVFKKILAERQEAYDEACLDLYNYMEKPQKDQDQTTRKIKQREAEYKKEQLDFLVAQMKECTDAVLQNDSVISKCKNKETHEQRKQLKRRLREARAAPYRRPADSEQ